MSGAKLIAPSTEQIQQVWDVFSDYYSENFQQITIQLATIAVSCLNIRHLPAGSSVVEVGCGPGETLELICKTKSAGTSVSAGDLSTKMVELTKARKLEGVSLESLSQVQPLDAENLPYADDSFDRYLSNLVIQIVNDPDKMLREAYRVLKKNGSSFAVFTAWGRARNSPMFTIPVEASAKTLQSPIPSSASSSSPSSDPKERSNFHLGEDLEATKDRVRAAGFRKVIGWYQTIVFSPVDADTYTAVMTETPASKSRLGSLPPETRHAFIEEVRARAREITESGKPIEWENIVLIAHA